MINEIIDDIGKIIVFLLVLLSCFLFFSKSSNRTQNALFGLFLLITSLDFTGLFLEEFYVDSAAINAVKMSSVLLQMPLFFLYVRTTCFRHKAINPKDSLHGVLFGIFTTILLIEGMTVRTQLWYDYVTQIQYYFYIVLIFLTLHRYKRIKRENDSRHDDIYSWFAITTTLFLTGNTMVMIRGIVDFSDQDAQLGILNLIISLFGLGVISWFVIKTMKSPSLFFGLSKEIEPITDKQDSTREEFKEELERLKVHMNSEKPFLSDSLTLQKLAAQIDIPEKQLSYLINREMGQHFFDYVNSFRIEEAQSLLLNSDLNVQEIMYDVGFNSKSSFNTAFKKHTSTTPSAFRKSNS